MFLSNGHDWEVLGINNLYVFLRSETLTFLSKRVKLDLKKQYRAII